MMEARSERARLEHKLDRSLGPEIDALLADASVADVMINEDGRVFVDRVGEGIKALELVFSAPRRMAMIKTLALCAGAVVNEHAPMLEAELPGSGARFQGVLPPVSRAPAVVIRKRAERVFTLGEYVEAGRLSEPLYWVLRSAVIERQNILVVGGTGSGKTTLLNALLAEVSAWAPNDRLLIIEDTRELQCPVRNTIPLLAKAPVTMQDLLRSALRMRPDRIVVGEVRGAEALTLIKAWNTGHPGGFSTVHANGAAAGLLRLEQLAAEGTLGFVPRVEISEAVQLVVSIARGPNGPRVTDALRVKGLGASGQYEIEAVAA